MSKRKNEQIEEQAPKYVELIEGLIIQDPLENLMTRQLIKTEAKLIRQSKHITQREMANLTGLSVACIADIENTKRGNPTLHNLTKYLDTLGYEITFQKKRGE